MCCILRQVEETETGELFGVIGMVSNEQVKEGAKSVIGGIVWLLAMVHSSASGQTIMINKSGNSCKKYYTLSTFSFDNV